MSVCMSVRGHISNFQLMKHLAYLNEILLYGKVMEAPLKVMEASEKVMETSGK